MKNHIASSCMALSLILNSFDAAVVASASPELRDVTTIEVDASSSFPVSADLYGAFYEEINRAGDSGLYAEMIRNRSFEDGVLTPRSGYENGHGISPTNWSFAVEVPGSIPGWSPVVAKGADLTLSLEREGLLNTAQERALRIDLHAAGEGGSGVSNSGLAGLSLENGATYRLTLWTKASLDSRAAIDVSLRAKDGQVLASAVLPMPSAEWEKRTVVLTSAADDNDAQLRLTMSGTCVWWLDMVSLFPEDTFNGHENGLRKDLVAMIEGLNPAFFRFPGGCIVEGFSKETIWHWKNTVGPIEERPEHQLLWGYRTTCGLGFHEFLQLSEDLDMEPMYVFNCGMTCQARNCELLGEHDIEQLIQDALDSLEYANGSTDTKYGAMRAANGHSEPFNIRYVEIGNENYGPDYERRYAPFYKAISEQHPDVRIIADAWVDSAPVDIIDEHFYPGPSYFISNYNRYDSYDRNGPEIYVGEYAVVQDCGRGNVRAAVAEAAFLTGIERNQDIVTMTSYAPLFVNDDYPDCWEPVAIYFDNHRAFGTPFYHVMSLFAENRGDEVFPVRVNTPTSPNFISGHNGLEIHGIGVSVSDFDISEGDKSLVTGQPSDILKVAEVTTGAPIATDAGITAGDSGNSMLLFPGVMTDGTVRMNVSFGSADGSVFLRVRDNKQPKEQRDFTLLELVSGESSTVRVRHVVGWSEEMLGSVPTGSVNFEPGRAYAVELKVKGEAYSVSIDGQMILECAMPRLPAVTASATFDNAQGELILKIVNTTDSWQRVTLSTNDLTGVGRNGILTTISGDPDEENSLDEPLRIHPVMTSVKLDANNIGHTFAPYSVNVLRLPYGKDL